MLRRVFRLFTHIPDTLAANILSIIGNQLRPRSAEDAGRLVFLQNDAVILHVDLQLIPFRNIQCAPQFNGQYDSAKVVYLTDNACRLHIEQLLPNHSRCILLQLQRLMFFSL